MVKGERNGCVPLTERTGFPASRIVCVENIFLQVISSTGTVVRTKRMIILENGKKNEGLNVYINFIAFNSNTIRGCCAESRLS